jgi:hypothetical protein
MRLDPEVQKLLDPALAKEKRLKPAVASMLASLPPNLQITLANEVLKQNLKTIVAFQHIRMRASQEGLRAGDPGRTPSESYRNLVSRLAMMQEQVELHLAMSARENAAMFEHRDPADYENVLEQLQRLASGINQLRDNLVQSKNNVPTL